MANFPTLHVLDNHIAVRYLIRCFQRPLLLLPSRGQAIWHFPDGDLPYADLAFEPGNPNVIYAALWQTRRPPWSVYPPANGGSPTSIS